MFVRTPKATIPSSAIRSKPKELRHGGHLSCEPSPRSGVLKGVAFHDIECEWQTQGGVRLRVSNCAPHASTPPHAHERPFVCLILGGVSVQRAGTRELTRERGRAYFYPADEVQSERFGAAGGRIFAFELAGVDRLPNVSCELSGPAALFARRCWTSDDDLDLDEAAASLAGVLSREREDGLRWMHVARDYLHAHFAEKLTLAASPTPPACIRSTSAARSRAASARRWASTCARCVSTAPRAASRQRNSQSPRSRSKPASTRNRISRATSARAWASLRPPTARGAVVNPVTDVSALADLPCP